MRVLKCPKCGRLPKIKYCLPKRNGTERRSCYCPNLCLVIPSENEHDFPTFGFIFEGKGDDNKILSIWNQKITRYEKEEEELWK